MVVAGTREHGGAVDVRFAVSFASAVAAHVLLVVGVRALAPVRPHKPAFAELAVEMVPARPDPMRAEPPAPRGETPPETAPVAPPPRAEPTRPRKAVVRASAKQAPSGDEAPAIAATPAPAKEPESGSSTGDPEAPPAPPPPTPAPPTPAVSVVGTPRYRSNPRPDYPVPSLRRREEGTVLLTADVKPDGTTSAVSLKQSCGFPMLDKAAIDAVRRWTFEPARVDGRAVATQVVVPVRFSLDDR
jgi:protein TonB